MMKFTFDQKWIPAVVVLAAVMTLIFTGKLDAEKAAAWAGTVLVALGLESKRDA